MAIHPKKCLKQLKLLTDKDGTILLTRWAELPESSPLREAMKKAVEKAAA
jgi:hypothetical protein